MRKAALSNVLITTRSLVEIVKRTRDVNDDIRCVCLLLLLVLVCSVSHCSDTFAHVAHV